MLKRAFFISSILIVVIGGVLLWQWKIYSNQIDGSMMKSPGNTRQKISIEVKDKFLQVTQRIDGLETGKGYRVFMPVHVQEWSCITESEKSCSFEDEDSNRFLAEGGSLTFVYRIPSSMGDKPFLLNDWVGRIEDASIAKTTIEIADSAKRKGTWIAGTPLKGFRELQHIDYYVFEGEDSTPSLYWHPSPLTQESINNGKLALFYENNKPDSLSFPNIDRLFNFPYTSIILTNQLPEVEGNGLMIVDSSNIAIGELELKMIDYYFLSKFEKPPVNERWLIDVISSLFLDKRSKSEKGDQVIRELKTYLNDEEVKKFIYLIMEEEGIPSVEKLDDLIGEVMGKGTRFFALNKDESFPFTSLYFFDPRKVYVEEKLQKDIEVLYFAEERYFPAIETFEALAYNVKVLADKKTLLLSKDTNTYRFYEDQNIFIYNEEDYGLLERPLRSINGEIFIKEKWLTNLFHVFIFEDTEMLKLII